MGMREQTNVIFKISSATLDPTTITARVGLTPDVSWLSGAMRGTFGAKEKEHGFVLESKLGPISSLDDHVKEMLKRLAPYAQKIGQLAAEATIEFTCSVQRKKAPALHFDRDVVRWLAVMGAKLDIDTFVIVEPPPPAPAKPAGTT